MKDDRHMLEKRTDQGLPAMQDKSERKKKTQLPRAAWGWGQNLGFQPANKPGEWVHDRCPVNDKKIASSYMKMGFFAI